MVLNRLLNALREKGRQSKKHRKSAVYRHVHEHFEVLFNAVSCLLRRFQQPVKGLVTFSTLLTTLTACSPFAAQHPATPTQSETGDGPPARSAIDFSRIPDAVPRYEPPSRYGNPPFYHVFGKRYQTLRSAAGFRQRGIASWYGTKFHGRRTSSGERYNMYAMTAAHKTLPLPSYAKVTNLLNGRQVIVKINDRGPFHEGRIIDLSYAAAGKLGLLHRGTAPVEIEAITVRPPADAATAVAPPAADSTAVYLQVGAFNEQDRARQLHLQLQHQYHLAHIQESAPDGTPRYRVRVGPLDSPERAEQVARQLQEQGLASFIVIE